MIFPLTHCLFRSVFISTYLWGFHISSCYWFLILIYMKEGDTTYDFYFLNALRHALLPNIWFMENVPSAFGKDPYSAVGWSVMDDWQIKLVCNVAQAPYFLSPAVIEEMSIFSFNSINIGCSFLRHTYIHHCNNFLMDWPFYHYNSVLWLCFI